MPNINQSDVVGALLATLSGVIVALFTSYLSSAREAARERRLLANTRALLALEVRANHEALAAFWRTINALGAGQAASASETSGDPAVDRLAALYDRGLASYTLPVWSTVRWQGIEPRTVAALSAKEVLALDGFYRGLGDTSDLYNRVATITPEDEARLRQNMGGRFWNLDLARERQALFARLNAAVTHVLDGADPLANASTSGK